jgi:hypothetical protein
VRVTKGQRAFVAFISLLYLSVAVVFGAIHDHHQETVHTDGHDDDCAACQWQLHANTDVPVCEVAPVILEFTFRQLVVPASLPAESPFLSSTASRAPPILGA